MITAAHAAHPAVSLRRLCALFGVNRAWYYRHRRANTAGCEEATRLRDAIERSVLTFPINSVQDMQERRALRALLQQEGRSQMFNDALVAALGRQAQKTNRGETVMRPARWAAGRAGGLVGRAMRKLEQQADKAEREKKQ